MYAPLCSKEGRTIESRKEVVVFIWNGSGFAERFAARETRNVGAIYVSI